MKDFFPPDRIFEIATSILQLVGYDRDKRTILLMGLPLTFASVLSGGNSLGWTGLLLDLGVLNHKIQLKDGTYPIKVFLKNAMMLAGGFADVAVIAQALEDVEVGTTGAARVAMKDALPETKERIVFIDDMVPFGFMQTGTAAARSVARLAIPCFDNGVQRMVNGNPVLSLGTGWILASGLLITNHHVINSRGEGEPPAEENDLRQQAGGGEALFDYDREDSAGVPAPLGELVAWDPDLDYAIMRTAVLDRAPLLRADGAPPPAGKGQNYAVNIIQHPQGRPKKYAIRNNLVTAVTPTELRYFTDTLGGSSGSPVLNDHWQVLALHRGSASVSNVQFQGLEVAFVNVGTPMQVILADLRARYAGQLPELGI